MSLGGGSPLQSPGPLVCPFPMPAQYEEAKESKVQTVAALRNSIKSVSVSTIVLVDCLIVWPSHSGRVGQPSHRASCCATADMTHSINLTTICRQYLVAALYVKNVVVEHGLVLCRQF